MKKLTIPILVTMIPLASFTWGETTNAPPTALAAVQDAPKTTNSPPPQVALTNAPTANLAPPKPQITTDELRRIVIMGRLLSSAYTLERNGKPQAVADFEGLLDRLEGALR
jgi:hypothetical protein